MQKFNLVILQIACYLLLIIIAYRFYNLQANVSFVYRRNL